MPTEIVTDRQIYDRLIQDAVIKATSYLWIATADIKDMYVKK